ncbi:iron ABC transporter permease [Oscillospiraceae bacterium N12]|jgi:iron complex transport system permease protein|uniref:Iron ABC transporter permease n=1 Tax=Jilunia laotingensis TaxID=2763675 RepID=A0A926IIE2_9BACT|nr:iron ABC transporter permease [Jilunia laotingensis]MBC8591657.1 iron ABC transporter permease [Jilunia laotingensis]
MKQTPLFLFLTGLLFFAFLADIAIGSVNLSFIDVWNTLTGGNDNLIYQEIILNHRLPKALTAILAGAALSVAGVLMQTLFHNPLAGPDVLGVTSGASLGVALLTLGTSVLPFWIVAGWGQVIAAIVGAVCVLLLVIIVSIRVPQMVSLLIIGMMFGYFAGAIVSILQSMSNPDTLKLFITWTFGSLSSVGWEHMGVMAPIIAGGIILSLILQKQLNVLLLGKNYANGLGISVTRLRLWIILATALLAGTSTAFTGPIGFIGITMPHVARGLFRTPNHRIILPASMLCGAIILLTCDLISQMPGFQGTLPINAVTAFFGAPIIIWIILKNRS